MNDHPFAEYADEALELMEAIRPLLAGKGADVQSAALAGLTSMWLAGVFIANDDGPSVEETAKMRAHMLEVFVDTVKRLVPVNEAMITRPMLDRKLGRR